MFNVMVILVIGTVALGVMVFINIILDEYVKECELIEEMKR